MSARSATEPVESPTLQPYLCEALPDAIGHGKFSIRTVVARRTFWDKVMLLSRYRRAFEAPCAAFRVATRGRRCGLIPFKAA